MYRSVLTLIACVVVALGCASAPERAVEEGRADMVHLGEQFETATGQVFLLRVQDEFRLIRCIPDGPIAGCYEDVYAVSDSNVDWNTWIDVDTVPGLRVAFVSPTSIAVTKAQQAPAPAPK